MHKKQNTLIKSLIGIILLLVVLIAAMLLMLGLSGNPEQEETLPSTEAAEETPAAGEVPDDTDQEAVPLTAQEIWEAENAGLSEAEGSSDELKKTADRVEYDSVPQYFQTDYPNDRYGRGTVESSGCSITSLAMVASYMTGHEYLPDELADYFGGYGENNMQKLEYASKMLQLPWKKAYNVHEVINAVEQGDLAIVMMNHKSIFTESQHFIVVAGMNEDGKFVIHDPYKPNYEKWDLKRAFESGFEAGDIICGYSGGWIYDVSAMPEEPFIYVEDKPYVEPRYPGIELTWEEQQLLARMIWVEARGEPAEGQQAIAEIVFNRMLSEDFPSAVSDVIYEENQFRSVAFLDEAEPSQAQYDAIDDALEGPYVLPIDVVHFATYPVNDQVWGSIGGHIFCYQWAADEEGHK